MRAFRNQIIKQQRGSGRARDWTSTRPLALDRDLPRRATKQSRATTRNREAALAQACCAAAASAGKQREVTAHATALIECEIDEQ